MRLWWVERTSRQVCQRMDIAMLFIQLIIPIGEWVLVTAAAGGVGIAAVQIAKGIVGFSFVTH